MSPAGGTGLQPANSPLAGRLACARFQRILDMQGPLGNRKSLVEMENLKMIRLLCGSLALMLASVAFAAPREPATGTNQQAKHRGKRTRGKHSKSSGTHRKTGTAPQADRQPIVK